MTPETTKTDNEDQVRHFIADLATAICAKDIEAIMSHYAPNAIIFNVKPPFQTIGAAPWRQTWVTSLAHFPDSFGIETRDPKVVASGDMALVHWLWHFTGMVDDNAATQTWLRDTVVCKKDQGRWQIVHEHCSVPFNPETGKAVVTPGP
jgi:ketosteroid isomerase-like protein